MMAGRRKILIIILSLFIITLATALNPLLNYIYRLPILMYHSIDYIDNKNDRLTISPETFSRQMAYLKSNGYNIIPLSEAVAYIRDKRHPPDKTVAITIDDGYENNYRYAYPVLKRYKIPATIFVVVDFVGKKGFLSWGELKELSASGLVDVESHTMSHPWLQYIEAGRLKYELEESKTILENRLGKKVRFICYPMGGYNENVKATARAAGYEAGFATKPTRLSPNYDIYEIKRVRISKTADNLLVFRIKVSGYHSFWRILQADYREIPYILWRKRSL